MFSTSPTADSMNFDLRRAVVARRAAWRVVAQVIARKIRSSHVGQDESQPAGRARPSLSSSLRPCREGALSRSADISSSAPLTSNSLALVSAAALAQKARLACFFGTSGRDALGPLCTLAREASVRKAATLKRVASSLSSDRVSVKRPTIGVVQRDEHTGLSMRRMSRDRQATARTGFEIAHSSACSRHGATSSTESHS